MHLVSFQVDGTYAKHAQNLLIMRALPWQHDQDSLVALFPAIFEATDTMAFQLPTATRPGVFYCADSSNMLVMIGGLSTIEQARNFVAGWQTPRTGNPYPDWDRVHAIAAQEIYLTMLSSLGLIGSRNVTLVGYSWGGGITAPLHAKIYADFGRDDFLQSFTYGAPRSYYGTDREPLVGGLFRRVFVASDPVPNIPPHYQEGGALVAAVSRTMASQMNDMVQPIGGYTLAADGKLDAVTETSTVANPHPLALPFWLIEANAFGAETHSLQTYYDRATAGLANYGHASVSSTWDWEVPTPEVRATVRNHLIEAGQRTLAQTQNQNVQRTVLDIYASYPQVADDKYRSVSIRGRRFVSYRGDIVATCNNRREQRRLVRSLNAGRLSS